jgi:hypothetical protein
MEPATVTCGWPVSGAPQMGWGAAGGGRWQVVRGGVQGGVGGGQGVEQGVQHLVAERAQRRNLAG